MDIHSLLSPQESPVDEHVPRPQGSPPKIGSQRKRDTPLIQQAVSSPLHHNRNLPPHLAHGSKSSSPANSQSPYSSNRSHQTPTGTPTAEIRPQLASFASQRSANRASSTPGMDTLADLASMQHHQQIYRQNSHRLRSSDMYETQRPASMSSMNSLSRKRGSNSSLKDFPLLDTPTPIPRTFISPSLSRVELQRVTELTSQLAENSYLYNVHVELINMLHRGLISHLLGCLSPGTPTDTQAYSLLGDLRQARIAMNSRFPVGEDIWLDWIKDEAMLAKTVEDRIAVMELCQRAVEDEVGSSKLWRLYGDWMGLLFSKAHDEESMFECNVFEENSLVGQAIAKNVWSEDDKAVGREVFNGETILRVWQQGVKATVWHIDDSHVVWNPYMELVEWDISKQPTRQRVQDVRNLFFERLQQPHAAWDETSQLLSRFISKYDNALYEETMVAANRQGSQAKEFYTQREGYENRLLEAMHNEDRSAEWNAMTEYLEWESTQNRKKSASQANFELLLGLYERANLRFPADADLWEDHLDMLMDKPVLIKDALVIAARATKHCPWSGSLWSKRLVTLESCDKDFAELEEVKHLATSTGLLDVGGMEELIKVYAAWCGYLRRKAFRPGATEDDRDIAEVAIRSSLDDIENIGDKKYGKEFKGDPLFRVEKVYLKFLGLSKGFDEARSVWHKLTLQLGDQYEFWDRYYMWEMLAWARFRGEDKSGEPDPVGPPKFATAVLQRAVRRPNLDWPEKMIELYIHHCVQHETIQRLQEALVEARRIAKQVASRRAREKADAEAAHLMRHQQSEQFSNGVNFDDISGNPKRKRDSASTPDGGISPKRQRAEFNEEKPLTNGSASDTSQLKRDRENTTLIVKKLPADCTDVRIRQFFRDCGDILSLNTVSEDDQSKTATIEFESREDILTAQTKSMKMFDGQAIEIQVGIGTTLWVTNYPPTADETYIRDLFTDYGEVVEVRFPSLKFDTHRRFCYVQFHTSREARAATELDGKALGGKYHLSAKISDPAAKKERTGAMQAGRELYVGNVDWSANEAEVKAIFEIFGLVEHVRIPRNMAGKSKGTAFVVFSTKEEAEAATAMNLKNFKDRILKVAISKSNAPGAKRQATTIIKSTSPDTTHGSPVPSSPDSSAFVPPPNRDYHERTIALLNVPDTVNDARIRALAEPFGPLKKIVLRPDHQGAIVEFQTIHDAGKAALGIEGHEIASGRFLNVGTVAEMLKHPPEKKIGGASLPTSSIKKAMQNDTAALHTGYQVKRPGQPLARGRGRGGLGLKTGGIPVRASDDVMSDAPNGSVRRSNADFKAMIEKR